MPSRMPYVVCGLLSEKQQSCQGPVVNLLDSECFSLHRSGWSIRLPEVPGQRELLFAPMSWKGSHMKLLLCPDPDAN